MKVSFNKLKESGKEREGEYLYIYVANETNANVDVFFDDLKVSQTGTEVLGSNTYYPFGTVIEGLSYTAPGANQKQLWSQKEKQEDLGLDWYDHGARMYDSEIGRWHVVDPMAAKYISLTPYNYCFNDPVAWNDLNGADPGWDNPSTRMSLREIQYKRNYEMFYYAPSEMSSNGFGSGMTTGGSGGNWISPNSPEYMAQQRQDLLQRAKAGDPGALQEYARRYGEYSIELTENQLILLQNALTYGMVSFNGNSLDFTTVAISTSGGQLTNYSIALGSKKGGGGLWDKFASGQGAGLEYNENLDRALTVAGIGAGMFELGAAVGTLENVKSLSIYKTGFKMTKNLGRGGVVLGIAVAGYELATGKDNTHTLVDIAITGLSFGAGLAFGTAALPAIVVGGIAYGIWSYAGGSDWIDNKIGYRDTITGQIK